MRSGFEQPDLIWTTVPGSSSLKALFPKAKLVFHSIDNYAAFQGSSVEKILAKDYERADHIFVIGESIRQDIMTIHGIDRSKITNLGQGVDLGGYKGVIDPPKDLEGIEGPMAIWVGVLKKLDLDYLKAVLAAMKKRGGTVVLIGPVIAECERLAQEYDNLVLLGSRNADEIPAYLSQADIGLMIYDRKKQDVYRGQHPLKLYEYAAAGLPIISTWHQEFQYLKPPIINLAPGDDMDEIVAKALGADRSFRNSIREFAMDHSWERCKDVAIKTLTNKGIMTNDKIR
jgi:glycosyltransferase involved in cell wall biosynthesis